MTDGDGPNSAGPSWRPVAAVRELTAVAATELEELEEQYALLAEARPACPRPRTVDEETVQAAAQLYGDMGAEYRDLHAEQARRWQGEEHDAATRAQVDAYAALVGRVRDRLESLLVLAAELATCTIERRTAPDR